MNKSTQKKLTGLLENFGEAASAIADHIEQFRRIADELTIVRDEEQDRYDEMSERLQESDKGEAMAESITKLNEAIEAIDAIIEVANDDAVTGIYELIDEAKGEQ